MRHLRHLAWSLAAGGGGWLLIMWDAGNCISPYEAPHFGCLATTITPYWIMGVGAGLVAFVAVLNHLYKREDA